jgi:tetratricopeptide (TPR) repeat protein
MTREETLEKLEARMQENPRSLLFARLADLYIQEGRLDEAIELCQKGLKHNPSYGTGHYILARAFMTKGDTEKAEAELKKVLAHDREHLAANKLLGDLMAQTGWETKAIMHFKEILRIDPLHEEAQRMLGSLSPGDSLDEISGEPLSVRSASPDEESTWTENLNSLFRDLPPSESVRMTDSRESSAESESVKPPDSSSMDTMREEKKSIPDDTPSVEDQTFSEDLLDLNWEDEVDKKAEEETPPRESVSGEEPAAGEAVSPPAWPESDEETASLIQPETDEEAPSPAGPERESETAGDVEEDRSDLTPAEETPESPDEFPGAFETKEDTGEQEDLSIPVSSGDTGQVTEESRPSGDEPDAGSSEKDILITEDLIWDDSLNSVSPAEEGAIRTEQETSQPAQNLSAEPDLREEEPVPLVSSESVQPDVEEKISEGTDIHLPPDEEPPLLFDDSEISESVLPAESPATTPAEETRDVEAEFTEPPLEADEVSAEPPPVREEAGIHPEKTAEVPAAETTATGIPAQGKVDQEAPRSAPPPSDSDTKKKIVSPTLGEIYAAQGQYSKAIKVYSMLLEKYPDNDKYKAKIQELKSRLDQSVS